MLNKSVINFGIFINTRRRTIAIQLAATNHFQRPTAYTCLARCMLSPVRPPVCPFVRLSVTRVDQSNRLKLGL